MIYLVVIATGILSLVYVPSQLIVSGDAAKTVENITASPRLFRFGVAAGLICHTAFLFLPLSFYRLLSHVHQNVAIVMVILAVVSVPISFGSSTHELDVLTLLSGKASLANQSSEQSNVAVMLSLAKYNNGMLAAQIFWGLWLFPLGYLVFRSGILPRILGVFLMVGCFGYLIHVFGVVLFPDFTSSSLARLATKPASIGEIGTCLWLLIMGARIGRNPGPDG